MPEETVPYQSGTRADQYESLLPQLRELIKGETDLIAALANIAAALREQFGFLWVGFYRRAGSGYVLGPFQGPVACARIPEGKGVCGTSALKKETIIVPDVGLFPGYIACSPQTRSEIVVPLVAGGRAELLLDADSTEVNGFSAEDREGLERVVSVIRDQFYR